MLINSNNLPTTYIGLPTNHGRGRKINRPSLLTQLQSILRKYPNDAQILRVSK